VEGSTAPDAEEIVKKDKEAYEKIENMTKELESNWKASGETYRSAIDATEETFHMKIVCYKSGMGGYICQKYFKKAVTVATDTVESKVEESTIPIETNMKKWLEQNS